MWMGYAHGRSSFCLKFSNIGISWFINSSAVYTTNQKFSQLHLSTSPDHYFLFILSILISFTCQLNFSFCFFLVSLISAKSDKFLYHNLLRCLLIKLHLRFWLRINANDKWDEEADNCIQKTTKNQKKKRKNQGDRAQKGIYD